MAREAGELSAAKDMTRRYLKSDKSQRYDEFSHSL